MVLLAISSMVGPAATAAPAPALQPDPTLKTAPLQITEVTPDTSNMGGADAFEFIEVYNASSESVDFSDYTLRYLYPRVDLSNSNVVDWPAKQRNVSIAPGATLVFWIKNGRNDSLTDVDFNAKFGTSLVMNENLVEIFTGGMANGSPRGLEISTNTGFGLNRAYYNLDGADNTVPDQGIHYAVNPDDPTRQTLITTAPATPGEVTPDQVPSGLVVLPPDSIAPSVTDTTAGSIDPMAPPGVLTLDIKNTEVRERFTATGDDGTDQMALGINSPTYRAWFDQYKGLPGRAPAPENPHAVTVAELGETWLTTNFWMGATGSTVQVSIDGGKSADATRTQSMTAGDVPLIGAEYTDPVATLEQLVHGGGVHDRTSHLWRLKLPSDLAIGKHTATVTATDVHGREFTEMITFEVTE
ncbi:calcineurin-like phosphoesterase C-terminal domain-containing protein [Arthrobacter sp. D2-10]